MENQSTIPRASSSSEASTNFRVRLCLTRSESRLLPGPCNPRARVRVLATSKETAPPPGATRVPVRGCPGVPAKASPRAYTRVLVTSKSGEARRQAHGSFHAQQTPNTRKQYSKSSAITCKSCMDVSRPQRRRASSLQIAKRCRGQQCSLCAAAPHDYQRETTHRNRCLAGVSNSRCVDNSPP